MGHPNHTYLLLFTTLISTYPTTCTTALLSITLTTALLSITLTTPSDPFYYNVLFPYSLPLIPILYLPLLSYTSYSHLSWNAYNAYLPAILSSITDPTPPFLPPSGPINYLSSIRTRTTISWTLLIYSPFALLALMLFYHLSTPPLLFNHPGIIWKSPFS